MNKLDKDCTKFELLEKVTAYADVLKTALTLHDTYIRNAQRFRVFPKIVKLNEKNAYKIAPVIERIENRLNNLLILASKK